LTLEIVTLRKLEQEDEEEQLRWEREEERRIANLEWEQRQSSADSTFVSILKGVNAGLETGTQAMKEQAAILRRRNAEITAQRAAEAQRNADERARQRAAKMSEVNRKLAEHERRKESEKREQERQHASSSAQHSTPSQSTPSQSTPKHSYSTGQWVSTTGSGEHWTTYESSARERAKLEAKEEARKSCPSGELKFGSWTFSNWFSYGRDQSSDDLQEREGYRYMVHIKVQCR
jgi:hypothetical protein